MTVMARYEHVIDQTLQLCPGLGFEDEPNSILKFTCAETPARHGLPKQVRGAFALGI
jgi:hypothetical protein